MKKFLPWIISLLFLVWAIAKMIPVKEPSGFDLEGFGQLPVLVNGRVMPMDTLARLSLFGMNHHGTGASSDGKVLPPTRWLLEVFMTPEHADGAKVFEVTNPDVLGLFGWQQTSGKANNYSFNDFKPFFGEIEKQAGLAAEAESDTQNAFQRAIIRLRDALLLYVQLKNTVQPEDSPNFGREVQVFETAIQPGMQAIRDRDANKPFNNEDLERILFFTWRYRDLSEIKYAYAIPNPNGTAETDRWQPISEALLSATTSGKVPDPVAIYGRLISAYRRGNADGFNQAIGEYNQDLEQTIPHELNRPHLEFLFNQAQPFLQALVLYIIVFVLTLISWLKWRKILWKTAVILLLLGFLIHTAGLITSAVSQRLVE